MYHIEIDIPTYEKIRDLIYDSKGNFFPGIRVWSAGFTFPYEIIFENQQDAMSFYKLLQTELNVTAKWLICV